MSKESDPRPAFEDLIGCLRSVFKDYTRTARTKAWNVLLGPTGRSAVHKLLSDPKAPLTGTPRYLRFKEWINS